MNTTDPRAFARALVQEHLAQGDATGWFERLYQQAGAEATQIPWADLVVNPHLAEWLLTAPPGAQRRALDVGCGLGDNAEALVQANWAVTAFDVSATAVSWAKRRFPDLPVTWEVANLMEPPAEWRGAFDLVVEIYTLQTLPPDARLAAVRALADCVAPGGDLLVIARGREPADPPGQMPWPLTREELNVFKTFGLVEASFEDLYDDEQPPVRRFRILYHRL